MSQLDIPAQNPRPRLPISIGAGAVVIYDECVLLVRNRFGVTKGRYLLPAGTVKLGEVPDQTAVRETFEETNLHIEVEGLLGVRLWVMDNGEHNYFFMFGAKLLSPISDLRPNLDEIDDARFFSREDLAALSMDETWLGAIAIAYKGLDPQTILWPNHANMSSDSGVDSFDRWRIWL